MSHAMRILASWSLWWMISAGGTRAQTATTTMGFSTAHANLNTVIPDMTNPPPQLASRDQHSHLRGRQRQFSINNPLAPQPRIINGDVVDTSRYPYFALMYGRGMCGAVLIGPRLVLGAAHCADADTRFRVGAWEDVNDGHEVGIKKSIVHENYSDSRYDHDIVLFQLEEDTPNPYIKLGKEEVTGGKLTVIGFGDIDPSVHKEISSVLREVELNYVDNESCDEGHGGNGDITEDMLCAWGRQKDSCVGDSGGPLFKRGNAVEDDELVGIVSWGRGCASFGSPGVYARVSYFYDWIVDTACREFPDDAPSYMHCGGISAATDSPTSVPTHLPTSEVSTKAPTNTSNTAPTLSPMQNPFTSVIPTPTQNPVASLFAASSPNYGESTAAALEEFLELPPLRFVDWASKGLLFDCEGDCDTDADCAGHLKCFQRDGGSADAIVPGCTDSKQYGANTDVCYDPNATLDDKST